jgi:DNA polymerase III subunit delta'
MSEAIDRTTEAMPFWQQPAWQQFLQRTQRQRVPHALLLSGAEGLGSDAFAARLAASLLCHQPHADAQACQRCRACAARAAGSHADFYEVRMLEKKASIGVDQIRALAADLALTPQSGQRQVALIYQADRMTVAAANALLKTLEEPSADTVILLHSERIGALLPTILSRCQKITLRAPERAEALAWLRDNASAAPATLATALDLAQGAPALALQMIDDASVARYAELAQDFAGLPGTRAKLVRRWADQVADFVRLAGHWLRAQMRQAALQQQRARLVQLSALQQRLQKLDGFQGTGVRLDLALGEWLAQLAASAPNVVARRTGAA